MKCLSAAQDLSNPRKWIKDNRDSNYSIRRVFNYDVKQGDKIVWHGSENGGHSIDQIKKIMSRNDILYTEYTYCEKGQLFNELYAIGNEKVVKEKSDPVKYGGYTTPKTHQHLHLLNLMERKRTEKSYCGNSV